VASLFRIVRLIEIPWEEVRMADVVFIAAIIGFFALSIGLVGACERLRRRGA
jgi:hypothetical protein